MIGRGWGAAVGCCMGLATLAACSSGPEVPAGATAGEPQMQQSAVPGTLVWRKPGLQAAQYGSFIIGRPDIYNGSDADFGGASEADKQAMAQYMDTEFRRALGQRYPITSTPGPHTATLDLTLVGMSDNVPVAATASRIAPVGIVSNVVRAATDSPPTFTGTVTIKGEFRDSKTGERLATFVTTKAPNAIDLGATLSTKDAQQAAINNAANDLRDSIANAQTAAVH